MGRSIAILSVILFISFPLRAQTVVVAKLDGAINPASADYLHRSIQHAASEHAECLIVELNTPGGLLKSTRMIVSDFLEAPIPIVVYVAPGGSQAASAGVFITMAANIAAMAPGTNIGAAHPVTLQGQMDSIMMEKSTNDAVAFIKSIAEKRNRNLAWAEEAVRKSLSITESEAVKLRVVDLVAKNQRELLRLIDGKEVEVAQGTAVLHTAEARIEEVEMGWSERILDILSDPNIAYILFMLGVYGLLFELYNPGSILPGVVGVISLILAFYSMHTLPINYAGLALIIFAIILFIAEIKVTSYGLLSVGGVISLLLGSLMLIRSESSLEFIQLSTSVVLSVTGTTLFFFLVIIGLGLKAQRRKPTTGSEGLIGETGVAFSSLSPAGTVRIHGEFWNAESVSGTIKKGERVRVVSLVNLTLRVEKLSS